MQRFLILPSLFLLASLSSCVVHVDRDHASLSIWNDSSYVIEEIYLSPTTSRHWGPDLLEGDVLYPDEEIVVDFIECDDYDVMVVDEHNYECVLEDMSLCFEDRAWRITNATLTYCY